MVLLAGLAATGAYAAGKGINTAFDVLGTQANAYTEYMYNRNLMDHQNELNKDYNQWNYTNAASLQRQGLEKAGYNPLLAVNNGATFSGGSAGLGSVNVKDSHLGTNAAQVKIADRGQRSQAGVNYTQEILNNSATEYNNAKTQTEAFNQQNIQADTSLKTIEYALNQKELQWKDRLYLNQIKTNIINAQANAGQAAASATNAKASMINATQGNPFKYGADKVDKYLNNTRSGRFIKSLNKYL